MGGGANQEKRVCSGFWVNVLGVSILRNTMTIKQLGDQSVCLAYTSILMVIWKKIKTGTQAGQGPGGRS